MTNPGPSHEAVKQRRRTLVSRLYLRGLTQREIIEALAQQGHLNPRTQQPWSLGTINGDVKASREEWRQERIANIQEHKDRQLAELREHRRQAWRDTELSEIRQSLKTEMDLLGTTEQLGSEERPFNIATVEVVRAVSDSNDTDATD